MKHLSLFSGMGGFDLAAEWMGWENIFHCEWNPFGQKILKYYWPKAISYADITKTDFSIHRGNIDILTGGFPCQPYSVSGQQRGTEDERHLWPHMLRAIREIKPPWVVGENVLGLVGWNGGLVFEEVQADLEAEGYEVQPYILPAASVNAPHRRNRVWFIAYNSDTRTEGVCRSKIETNGLLVTADTGCGRHRRLSKESIWEKRNKIRINGVSKERNAANPPSIGQPGKKHGKVKSGWLAKKGVPDDWSNFPTQSPICDGNDGISSQLDGITFSKWRNESIKAGGNAIVPQVVLQIFKAIYEYEKRI